MNTVCLYFEVHQPFRLKPYSYFQIGSDHLYLDAEANASIAEKVARKCYMPATDLLLQMIRRYGSDFKVSFAISGTALEQFQLYAPEVLENFRKLAATGSVEFLAETYYHSLSGLFSEREFRRQVDLHMEAMKSLLGVRPTAFRNTELIFNNHVAWLTHQMGFRTMLLEGTPRVLGWRSPNFVYRHALNQDLRLLLKNYQLSDDIAFRFSDRNWTHHPLSAETFASWLHSHAGSADTLNLFMDFETFGEHQWADSGIFQFLEALPSLVMAHQDFRFRTVSEAVHAHPVVGEVESHEAISWADTERDVSAWLGNSMQRQAAQALYALEADVYESADPDMLRVFGLLQTSDHLYYMCTKHWNDGAVHKYFSPYSSPYDAYVYFMNVLADFRQRVLARRKDRQARDALRRRSAAARAGREQDRDAASFVAAVVDDAQAKADGTKMAPASEAAPRTSEVHVA